MIDGALVVKDGEHRRLDAERVKRRAREEARALVLRANL
jgi:hypothetical protein